MIFKHDVTVLVLIIAKYRLLCELFWYSTVQRVLYNRIILVTYFFYFAVLKIHVASKILEQTACTNKLIKKTKLLQM